MDDSDNPQKTASERGKENYEKGLKFEIAFAEFLKNELGWEAVEKRRNANRGQDLGTVNIDLIAKKTNSFGLKMKKWSKIYLASFCSLILLGICEVFILQMRSNGIGTIVISTGSIILGAIAFPLSIRYNLDHAWVECKNTTEPVSIKQISDMLGEYEMYKKKKDKKFKFRYLYYASANGFRSNALTLALNNGIHCYITDKNGNFVKVHDELFNLEEST